MKHGLGDEPTTKRTKVGLRERDQVPIESTTSKAGPNVRPTKACDGTPPNRYATEINLVAVKQWRHQGIAGAMCLPIPVAFTRPENGTSDLTLHADSGMSCIILATMWMRPPT